MRLVGFDPNHSTGWKQALPAGVGSIYRFGPTRGGGSQNYRQGRCIWIQIAPLCVFFWCLSLRSVEPSPCEMGRDLCADVLVIPSQHGRGRGVGTEGCGGVHPSDTHTHRQAHRVHTLVGQGLAPVARRQSRRVLLTVSACQTSTLAGGSEVSSVIELPVPPAGCGPNFHDSDGRGRPAKTALKKLLTPGTT